MPYGLGPSARDLRAGHSSDFLALPIASMIASNCSSVSVATGSVCTVTSLELFKIYTGELTKYTYVNGDDMYGVDIVYLVRKFHGELKPQKDEVNKLEFVKLDDIKGKLSPRNKQIIKDLKAIL